MVKPEEFKSFKDDRIQKSNTFLDSLKSRNIYKILMLSNRMIKTKATNLESNKTE